MTRVGRDELYYRFLEQDYGSVTSHGLVPTDGSSVVHQVTRRMTSEESGDSSTGGTSHEEKVRRFFAGTSRPKEADEVAPFVEAQYLDFLSDWAKRQDDRTSACDRFLEDFPTSRYVPCVLFLKGIAMDLRVDIQAFRRQGQMWFSTDFPSERSRNTWRTLIETYPDSPLSDAARVRLAQLEARQGRIDEAVRLLREMGTQKPVSTETERRAEGPALDVLLAKKPAEDSLKSEYLGVVRQAAELLSLLEQNRDSQYNDAPLILLMRCDPLHPDYPLNLREIVDLYPHTELEDNIGVKLSLAEPSVKERIRKLEGVLKRFPNGDALPEVLCELGSAYLQSGDLTKARRNFDRVIQQFPQSSYAASARLRLSRVRLSGGGS